MFNLYQVPGNFHFSSHAYISIIEKLVGDSVFKFDLTHKINHLSFGDEKDFVSIRNHFTSEVDTLSPLDGKSKVTGTDMKKVYEYYLKVIPTQYVDINKNVYNVHQITANDHEYNSQFMLPSIFFRYDLSAITVKNEQYKETLFHFFVQICAIVGGVFTVVGLIDSVVNKFFSNLMNLFGIASA